MLRLTTRYICGSCIGLRSLAMASCPKGVVVLGSIASHTSSDDLTEVHGHSPRATICQRITIFIPQRIFQLLSIIFTGACCQKGFHHAVPPCKSLFQDVESPIGSLFHHQHDAPSLVR